MIELLVNRIFRILDRLEKNTNAAHTRDGTEVNIRGRRRMRENFRRIQPLEFDRRGLNAHRVTVPHRLER